MQFRCVMRIRNDHVPIVFLSYAISANCYHLRNEWLLRVDSCATDEIRGQGTLLSLVIVTLIFERKMDDGDAQGHDNIYERVRVEISRIAMHFRSAFHGINEIRGILLRKRARCLEGTRENISPIINSALLVGASKFRSSFHLFIPLYRLFNAALLC